MFTRNRPAVSGLAPKYRPAHAALHRCIVEMLEPRCLMSGVISVNFGPNSLAAGDTAGVIASSNWNNTNASSITNLNDDTGTATGASLTLSSGTSIYSYTTLDGTSTGDYKLMSSYRGLLGGTLTVAAANLPASLATYDVYVYWGGHDATLRTPSYTLGSTTYVLKDSSGTWDGTHDLSTATSAATAIDGNDYLKFAGVSGSSFSIAINQNGGGQRFGIAGLQIVAATPAAPSSLAATAVSPSQVNLTWTDNATNETGFAIDRATDAVFASGLVTTTAGANATTANITGLSASTTYYFRVRATNAAGASANSNTATAATPANTDADAEFTPSASSYLGGTATTDSVVGSAIQADGTVVLAANISTATPGGLVPTLLNGATSTTSGAILRLSGDGKTVLSVTRIASTINDMSIDASGNIYVAALTGGAFKLDPAAASILWSDTTYEAERIDAADDGSFVALSGALGSDNLTAATAGTLRVYSGSAALLGSFTGHNKTYDVCINSANQSVYLVGFNQTSGPSGNPVQIAYTRSVSYAAGSFGSIRWTGYDWTGTQVDDPAAGGTGPTNNMADTRGVRCDIGADGKFYVLFNTAGGNHIFRYDPFNLFTTVSIVGGDAYHTFSNSKSEHKAFFARYDADTGNYMTGQQLTARLNTGAANTLTPTNGGDIQADASGRVYLALYSGSGDATTKTTDGLPFTYDPIPNTLYGGGPVAIVMSADFTTRILVTRGSSDGRPATIAARTLAGESTTRIVYGGYTASAAIFTNDAVQPARSGTTQDGFFEVFNTGIDLARNLTPMVSSTVAGSAANLTDGNTTTGWQSAASDPQTVTIDLGVSAVIDSVRLTWGVNYAKSYTIDVSNDGVTWYTIHTTTSGAGGTVRTSKFNTGAIATARYVRVTMTARNSLAFGYDLNDISVLGLV